MKPSGRSSTPSCTSRDINLSKTSRKNYCEGPIQDATGA
jgi:hypothetical protein